MSTGARAAIGAIAALLGVWMVVLFLVGPTITYQTHDGRNGEIEAECSSLIAMGWPNNEQGHLLSENGSGVYDDHIEPMDANLSRITRDGIYRDCDRRRTANAGFIGLLSAPTTLLAALALIPRRRVEAAKATEPGQSV